MNPENPAALPYMLQDDIYLLPADRNFYLHQVKSAPQPQTPEIIFKYLGGYKNRVLITTHYPEHEHMEPLHLTALTNTLQRLQISMDDVGILNMAAHTGLNMELIIQQLQPQKLLILGAAALPEAMPEIIQNQPQQAGDALLLYTFGFGEMIGNKEHTKTFWNLIKQF